MVPDTVLCHPQTQGTQLIERKGGSQLQQDKGGADEITKGEAYPMPKYSYVGKSIPRVDAKIKVTGEAIFTSDFKLPGMLWGKIKRSPYPSAKILSIDTSQALKLPGVRAVITARDITQFSYGTVYGGDELPLARNMPVILGMR